MKVRVTVQRHLLCCLLAFLLSHVCAHTYVTQFAGLYDTWTNNDGDELHSFTILTTNAAPHIQWMHTRMPVRVLLVLCLLHWSTLCMYVELVTNCGRM